MTYELSSNNINLNAIGTERILQNGRNILAVMIGEVVLGREIGINGDIIDSPSHKNISIFDIKEQFKKYEPRLKVHDITYKGDGEDGLLNPVVEVSIIE
ncbi:hypothetical protein [Psychrilyobacter sp.]|uniref:hypothetical protein n=1 Tax=Psychrilyobacter sp. TaxID=2586924 RepID=UPI00301625C3